MMRYRLLHWFSLALAFMLLLDLGGCAARPLNQPPPGFVSLFNGENLDGWKGLVANPPTRAGMSEEALAAAQVTADERMAKHWRVEDGCIVTDGHGANLCTTEKYANFELFVDWKIGPGGDSGVYLRGSPQVQIWENEVGSGGLYNNQNNPSKPLSVQDRPAGEWNRFHIIMIGGNVTVSFNGRLVVNNIPLENYWEREKPIYPAEAIELQAHGSTLYFRNIFLREITDAELMRMYRSQRYESASIF